MQHFSIWSLLRNAMSYHEGWQRQWRDAQPQAEYDAVVIGGGGHGLATAYYLAKEHGMRRIAVVEKGWLGGGNTVATRRLCAAIICGMKLLPCMKNP